MNGCLLPTSRTAHEQRVDSRERRQTREFDTVVRPARSSGQRLYTNSILNGSPSLPSPVAVRAFDCRQISVTLSTDHSDRQLWVRDSRSRVGLSDSTPGQSTADGCLHPQRLIHRKPYREVRKTAKIWQLGWGLPAGRKATTPFLRGRPCGPQGQPKSNPTSAWDAPPYRVAVRRVDGPACGPVSNWGLRSLGVDTTGQETGEHARPHSGPNQTPANRSTREGKVATGCGITGMPTACGIPRLSCGRRSMRAAGELRAESGEALPRRICRVCPPCQSSATVVSIECARRVSRVRLAGRRVPRPPLARREASLARRDPQRSRLRDPTLSLRPACSGLRRSVRTPPENCLPDLVRERYRFLCSGCESLVQTTPRRVSCVAAVFSAVPGEGFCERSR